MITQEEGGQKGTGGSVRSGERGQGNGEDTQVSSRLVGVIPTMPIVWDSRCALCLMYIVLLGVLCASLHV